MLKTDLREERYLPFEGAGVISEWQIEFPPISWEVDYDAITDIILHVRYTARNSKEWRLARSRDRSTLI